MYEPVPTVYPSNRGTKSLAQYLTCLGLVSGYVLKSPCVLLKIKIQLAVASSSLEVTKIRYPNNTGSLAADYRGGMGRRS